MSKRKQSSNHHYMTAMVQLPLLVREAANAPYVRTSVDVETVCSDLKGMAQESFHVLILNTRNRCVNRVLVTLGLVDSSIVHPREVFRQAIIENAAAVVLVHNHPSGDPSPSAEDLRITKQLIQAGKIVDIEVMDHCIIGDSVFSMREQGMCEFA